MRGKPGIMLLVDTNLWVENYSPNRSDADEAHAFIDAALRFGAVLLYPAGSLKDVFYLVDRDLKRRIRDEKGKLDDGDAVAARAFAWACIENMREIGTAVGVDEADLWLASKLRPLNSDLEDNLVMAAAERAHAAYLVTDDERLRRKATVPAKSAADMRELIEYWGIA